MAQAARLNLRMQKELKLLLTDPPPGASFPNLSPTSDLSTFSLTAIDALIEGPEGTVYEKGVFKIKIQIPERYPFQPPVVTFSTPIYHPNIDTGGRICLDILNVPPKGAWQPSINISTVLTSIGLLLSEPNPDDGLMCEASKEYKYNKQVFDQKARSMTEKYAKIDASPSHGGLQPLTESSITEDKAVELVKTDMHEYAIGFKRPSGISRKLSLDASGSNTRESDTGMNKKHLCESQVQEPNQDFKEPSFQYNKNHVVTMMNSDRDQDIKPPAISSKKLCISGKHLRKEVPDSTKRLDDRMPTYLDAQKENLFEFQKETDMHVKAAGFKRHSGISRKLSLDASGSNTRERNTGMKKAPSNESQIKKPNQDSDNMTFEYRKIHDTNMMNSDRDQDIKPPAISSKKLCLTGKNLKNDVPDSTKRLDNVLPTDLDKQKENLLGVQKETDVGFKRLSVTGKKLSLDATGSNTRESGMGKEKAPLNESLIQKLNQESKNRTFEYSKTHVMTMMNSDRDQDTKPPAISSKKLCLSNKKLQKEVLDSAKRKSDAMPTDLDAQKENLIEVQKSNTDRSFLTNPKRKKLGLTGKKPSIGFLGLTKNKETDNKGDTGSGVSNTSKVPQAVQKGANSKPVKLPRKPLQVLEEKRDRKLKLKADNKIPNTKHDGERSDEDIFEQEDRLCDPEGVIVLDSEDSGEETNATSSSRCLIARKRVLGKH